MQCLCISLIGRDKTGEFYPHCSCEMENLWNDFMLS